MPKITAEITSKALRIKGGGTSFKAPKLNLRAGANTKIDTFTHNKTSAAYYKVLAETRSGKKDIFDLHVLADKSDAKFTIYGRLTIGALTGYLVDISVTVDNNKAVVYATPVYTAEPVKISIIPTYIESVI